MTLNTLSKPNKKIKLQTGLVDMLRINTTSLQLAQKRQEASNNLAICHPSTRINHDVLLFPIETADIHQIDTLCETQTNDPIRIVDLSHDPCNRWSINPLELHRIRADELTGTIITDFLCLLSLKHRSPKCNNIAEHKMRYILELEDNSQNIHA